MKTEVLDPQPFPLLQWFAGLALCIVIFSSGVLNIFLFPKGGVAPFLLTTLAAFSVAFEQGGLPAPGITFYVRALLIGLIHSAYTACTGAGIGYAREAKTPTERMAAPLVGYFLAMFLHFAWNFNATFLSPVLDRLTGGNFLVDVLVLTPLTVAVLEGPAWVTLLVLAHLAWKRERALIAAHLQDEPEDVVRKEELPLLASPLRRLRLLWRVFVRSGVRQWADLRALFDLLADFAFAKHDVAEGRRTAAELDRYRTRIRELRRRLGSAAGAHEGNVP